MDLGDFITCKAICKVRKKFLALFKNGVDLAGEITQRNKVLAFHTIYLDLIPDNMCSYTLEHCIVHYWV